MRKPRVHRPSAPESDFLSARGQPNRRSMPAPVIVLREASGLRSRRRSRARPDHLRVTSTKACAPGIVNGPSSGAWRSPHHSSHSEGVKGCRPLGGQQRGRRWSGDGRPDHLGAPELAVTGRRAPGHGPLGAPALRQREYAGGARQVAKETAA